MLVRLYILVLLLGCIVTLLVILYYMDLVLFFFISFFLYLSGVVYIDIPALHFVFISHLFYSNWKYRCIRGYISQYIKIREVKVCEHNFTHFFPPRDRKHHTVLQATVNKQKIILLF